MAAQRFGGKYSPGAQPAPPPGGGPNSGLHGRRPARVGARVNALFLLPFAFAATAFFQPATGLALDLAATGILLLAAWLTREGERAHEAWEARTVARRPALPRKTIAAALTGLGVGLGALIPAEGPLAAVLLGVLAGVLHFAAFGPDPMKDKGMEGTDRFQTERVARAVDEAERTIAAMRDAILRAADRDLTDRVDRFAATARELFRRVENDPRDLTAARRYLSVYLQGARDATARFADLYARSRDAQARADYVALLDDLDTRFAERSRALMENDRTSLDVEIEVLRERLAYESPRP
ncbi:5-bromo-4-chloroindolyl phosphate hydrolysis family protein [Ruixingdingia sedimenti]|uniref:5-bromo-4-chloroindolyl phosphate hydrolysis family protein n=1 Tax=Ruixingdingia sedimenti TaxID=3073604 RepID=A0ABU1F5F1_9RHOB|nr:5-bromo-4-chloroindolyl phosphate hydrolysis family protein [Xinfangfangia sp. LG-4]MDR5652064.1 5-bromo-4-chloroindolyl phosphate hydrolysis family protein [Xinfangfangia sp. LG-4]